MTGSDGKATDNPSAAARTRLARVALGPSTHVRAGSGDSDGTCPSGDGSVGLELDLDDPAQREFGDYELREPIGRGGMGMVYRAHQRSLDRPVAIKLLVDGAWATPDFIDALRREARNAARLQHPSIVTIYDFGEHGDLVYYAMALVDGESLAQRLARTGPLPPREAAACLRTVAEAVDYAHRLGVLHLDLKPANVILAADGVPRITDFGLARRVDHPQAVADDSIAGTPGYMAPEQLVPGNVLGPAADVWGLGATLYEALTGHAPFERSGMRTLESMRRRGQVRNPRRYHPKLSRDLEAICLRCLQVDPGLRYPSARALADDLGRFLEGRQVNVRPLGLVPRTLRWARRERRLAAISLLAVVALATGLVATNHLRRVAEDSAASARENLWAQRHETAWRLLQEGRDYQVLPLLAANLAEQEQAGATRAAHSERLRLQLIRTQAPMLLAVIDAGEPVHALALSDDGRHVALGLGENRVALYSIADGTRLWQVDLGPEAGLDGDSQLRHLRFTPDHRWLLVTEHAPLVHHLPGASTHRLAVADGQRTIAPDRPGLEGATYQAWSPDGRHVLLSDRRGWMQMFEAAGWRPLGPKRLVPIARHHDWLIAPGTAFVAMIDGTSGLHILDPHTLAARHTLAPGPESDRFRAWAVSPDARHLALGRMSGEVMLMDPRDGSTRVLLPGIARPAWLTFSADGTKLAASFASGDFLILGVPDGRIVGRVRDDNPLWGHQFDCGDGPARPQETCLALLMEFDRIRIWSTPSETREGGSPAQVSQVAPEITHPSFLPRFASMFDRRRGLLATGGQDGSLRLWRLPPTPLLPWPAPTRQEAPLAFDGQHVVTIDGGRLQVFDVATGRAASPPMLLPDVAGFAVLTGDGRGLVASSGHELHVFDWSEGRLRFPPIALGGSPSDLAFAPDGSAVVARWLDAAAEDGMGTLRAWSLIDGQALGPSTPQPFTAARVIEGGRLLLDAPGATMLFDLADLGRPRLRFPAPAGSRVQLTAHAPGRDEVVQYLQSPLALENGLRRWSLRDGQPLGVLPIAARAFDLQQRGSDGRMALSGTPGFTALTDVSLLLDVDGETHAISTLRGARLVHAQAFSPDGAILAQAVSTGVLLVDVDSGRPLGPALRHWLPDPDEITQLAFSPDGRGLLARTFLGRWMHWRLSEDERPVTVLASEAALVSPTEGGRFSAPDPAVQALLRERRQAAPHAAQIVPFPLWSCLPATPEVPPRPPGLPPEALDLGALFTAPLHHPIQPVGDGVLAMALSNRCWIPMGRQRLLGVDYDLRGLFTLSRYGNRQLPDVRGPETTGRIVVPPGRYDAARVLNALATPMQAPSGPVAAFTFHYRDGSRGTVPMHSAPTPTYVLGEDHVLPDGLRTALTTRHGDALFAAELRNPRPGREVSAIELRMTAPASQPWALVVFAITLQPGAPEPIANATARDAGPRR